MLFVYNSVRKLLAMRKFILLLIALFLSVSGFTQTGFNSSDQRKDSVFAEKQKMAEVKIYPNPIKNNRVSVEFKSHLISEIQITNIAGKLVFSKRFDFAEMKKQLQLDDFKNGMYLLKVKSTDNKVVVKKLIVSRQ